jgi:hypothetical protein
MSEAVGSGTYTHPAWLSNLIEQVEFGPGLKPAFACLERAGRSIIVLPLLIPVVPPWPNAPWRARDAHALANYYSPLACPPASVDATQEDWQALFLAMRQPVLGQGRLRLDRLRLAPLDDPALTPGQEQIPVSWVLLQALQGAGWRARPYFCFGNWFQTLDDSTEAAGAWATYWAARDGALRNTALRMGRRFRAAGGSFEVVTGGERLSWAIAGYCEVYGQSWKTPEPHPGFMPGLVRLAAEQGWLRLGLASLGGQVLAAQLWLVNQGKADIYKLAYREDAAAWSPGTLLTEHMMQHAITQDRVREVDYLMGDDVYKRQWMDRRRERWGLDAINPGTWRGRLALVQDSAAEQWRRRGATSGTARQ